MKRTHCRKRGWDRGRGSSDSDAPREGGGREAKRRRLPVRVAAKSRASIGPREGEPFDGRRFRPSRLVSLCGGAGTAVSAVPHDPVRAQAPSANGGRRQKRQRLGRAAHGGEEHAPHSTRYGSPKRVMGVAKRSTLPSASGASPVTGRGSPRGAGACIEWLGGRGRSDASLGHDRAASREASRAGWS